MKRKEPASVLTHRKEDGNPMTGKSVMVNFASLRDRFSELLEEISSKENWYSKVFDDKLVSVWQSEFLATHSDPVDLDLFEVAINLLRATAQGSSLQSRQVCYEQWDPKNKRLCLKCRVAEDVDEDEDDLDDYDLDLPCPHLICACVSPHHRLENYVRTFGPGELLEESLRLSLKSVISEMMKNEPVDWHPGSNQQVRDLVHPSLFCYVKGVSGHTDGSTLPFDPVVDDESLRFQWLPSDFSFSNPTTSKTPEVKLISPYINNLDASRYPTLIPLLEKTLAGFLPDLLPLLNSFYSSSSSISPNQKKTLQVIVKIGSTHLEAKNPNFPGGSWHIEGMPYEHIAATCIHYLEVQGITDSFLQFRKPVYLNENTLDYPQNDKTFTTHHYGIGPSSHHGGTMNRFLGSIQCREGVSVIFPNTLQHRVAPFALAPPVTEDSKGQRIILAFFVIDPRHRIISTSDVPPQQGLMDLSEAHHFRERLMFHRKFVVKLLNKTVFERSFSLCEH